MNVNGKIVNRFSVDVSSILGEAYSMFLSANCFIFKR